MKLTKLPRVLKFKQSEKSMNAANDFQKQFFKLMINSVYGKAMED